MAGTITTSTIQNDTSSPPVFRNNSVEIGTLCRAWVNFNGTGTVAIRASFNVSSITDNGTGDYTVNFTTAMPDTLYALIGTGGSSTTSLRQPSTNYEVQAPTTSAARIQTAAANGALADTTFTNIAVFR